MAHGTDKHERKEGEKEKEVSKEISEKITNTIKLSYQSQIDPIFKKSCMDCHAVNKNLPWYSKVPFAGNVVKNDAIEAKKHLDMTNGFPFEGHGDISGDLNAIFKSINNKSMPPKRYLVMNWNSSLSKPELTKVNNWIKKSQSLINKKCKSTKESK